MPVVNDALEIESILDPGSQICSASACTAESLGLNWNPDIKIRMQSANGSVDETLGLVTNVPFRFGNITIYLQLHILKDAAYNIFLGRPFDCHTESQVQNHMNGSQTLTLRCLNTNVRVAIQTFDRGKLPPKASPARDLPDTPLDPKTTEVKGVKFQ
jgi:hypothetical protein